jgi:hypothetical protein
MSTTAPVILAVGLVVPGFLFLCAAFGPEPRWTSWWERALAFATAGGWLVAAYLMAASALSPADARTDAVTAGAFTAIALAVGGWLVRDVWEAAPDESGPASPVPVAAHASTTRSTSPDRGGRRDRRATRGGASRRR